MTTPIGELRSALNQAGWQEHLFEVFAHPFTAGETVAQSRLGELRVNGLPAHAEVVDVMGNGDYVLRIETLGATENGPEVQDDARPSLTLAACEKRSQRVREIPPPLPQPSMWPPLLVKRG